jgi:hypothetical protein
MTAVSPGRPGRRDSASSVAPVCSNTSAGGWGHHRWTSSRSELVLASRSPRTPPATSAILHRALSRAWASGHAGLGGTSRTTLAEPGSRSPWMSSTNACGSSKRVPGSRPAALRNSLSPCTRPSIHLAHTSWPCRLPPISTLATPVPSPFVSEILACVRSCIVIFSSGLGRTTGNKKGQSRQCRTSGSRTRWVGLSARRANGRARERTASVAIVATPPVVRKSSSFSHMRPSREAIALESPCGHGPKSAKGTAGRDAGRRDAVTLPRWRRAWA